MFSIEDLQQINGEENIIVTLNGGKMYLITAYFPSSDKWEGDMKTRRRKLDEMY